MEPFHILSETPKVYIFVHFGTNELINFWVINLKTSAVIGSSPDSEYIVLTHNKHTQNKHISHYKY